MNLAVVGRLSVTVNGERVVIGPFSQADMDATMAMRNGFSALELFARHIEEPADVEERGTMWVYGVAMAWRDAMDAAIAKLRIPANRAARRHQN